jgi:Domain of unknown function (DUF4314)
MSDLLRDHVERKRAELVGRRIELVRCTDEYTKLEPGERGTIASVDEMGTVHVNWDNGSNLGLVLGEDEYRVLD